MRNTRAMTTIILMTLAACHEPPHTIRGTESTVNLIYGRQDPLHSIGADTSLFSKTLSHMLQRAIEVENLDRERMPLSESPTDKPLILEGEIFAGLHEGYTSYQTVHTNVKEDVTLVTVRFSNAHYGISWTDTLELSLTKDWKLHDVRYGKGGTLQQTLQEFISAFVE